MRTIQAPKITKIISGLCLKANFSLRCDVYDALRLALRKETNKSAKKFLQAIIDNADIAYDENLAICQDTGMPIVFLEIGQNVRIVGDLTTAVNKGIEAGYRKGSLRNSIVKDPLQRGACGYAPVVLHTDIVKGSKLKITVLPKGFGCENKSVLKMFNPTADSGEIKEFIVQTVKSAGPNACPPYVVGVGIGGTADYASLLAKKALLRKITHHAPRTTHHAKTLENDLLREINALNIGPMGLGGKTTAFAVHVETYPTHIAGLPVAVNISCHALRSASKVM